MPMPKVIARLNKVGLNRVTRYIAPWMPGFGMVLHQGRRSGRTYQTPINIFRTPDGFVAALTYGSDSDWVKNVVAAGGCELITRRRRYRLVDPHLYRDERLHHMPAIFVRQVLRLAKVDEFLALKPDPAAEQA
jgi:deazaflavin-dependent oxidoreductase (nitroreductase family)